MHRRGIRGTVWTETNDRGEHLLCAAGELPHLARRIGDFLKREARRDVEAASRRYVAQLGVSARSALPCAISRAAGVHARPWVALSYSWRLILAPPYVLDYLAAHEVAHLVEMNHSRKVLAAGRSHLPEHAACQSVA